MLNLIFKCQSGLNERCVCVTVIQPLHVHTPIPPASHSSFLDGDFIFVELLQQCLQIDGWANGCTSERAINYERAHHASHRFPVKCALILVVNEQQSRLQVFQSAGKEK